MHVPRDHERALPLRPVLPPAGPLRPGGDRHAAEEGKRISGGDGQPALAPPWTCFARRDTRNLEIGLLHSSQLSRERASTCRASGTVAAVKRTDSRRAHFIGETN